MIGGQLSKEKLIHTERNCVPHGGVKVTDKDELLRVIKFVRANPENKRQTVKCSEHGEQLLIIIDNGPEQDLSITGCCKRAINELHTRIAYVTMLHDSQHPS